MKLEEYLAIPYQLEAYSAIGDDGVWHRYAAYPEIDCVIEADTTIDAIEKLEQERVRTLIERFRRGDHIPVPRPPLRSLAGALDLERLGFAKWLVENRHLDESDVSPRSSH